MSVLREEAWSSLSYIAVPVKYSVNQITGASVSHSQSGGKVLDFPNGSGARRLHSYVTNSPWSSFLSPRAPLGKGSWLNCLESLVSDLPNLYSLLVWRSRQGQGLIGTKEPRRICDVCGVSLETFSSEVHQELLNNMKAVKSLQGWTSGSSGSGSSARGNCTPMSGRWDTSPPTNFSPYLLTPWPLWQSIHLQSEDNLK